MHSCQVDPNPCGLSEAVMKDIYSLDSVMTTTKKIDKHDEWMNQNYDEPSILFAEKETYRFFWEHSFGGTKIYRIEQIDNHFKATKKVFESHDDTIGITNEFYISKEVWTNIVDSLTVTNFWTYPTFIDRQGLDGASWFLEGYKPIKDKCTLKNYHYIGRWSPIDTTFISMCDLFSNLKEE